MNQEKDAIQRKRHYPTLDFLVRDDALEQNVAKGDPAKHLTLGIALLGDDHLPEGAVIRALEENLSCFVPGMGQIEREILGANLLNGSDQFLNTLSELGVARHYLCAGWNVSLARKLPGGKDVDLYLEGRGSPRWLDVLNSAAKEWERDGSAVPVPADFERRLVDKVAEKFESKFREALSTGWSGAAWIALEFAKRDSLLVDVAKKMIEGNNHFSDALGRKVLLQCPELAGVAYFTYYATETKANLIQEIPR